MNKKDSVAERAFQYASYLEEQDAFLQAPARMKPEILEKSRKLNVQIVVQANAAAKKLDFWLYSLRVGFAVTFAICMLFCTSFTLRYHPPALTRGENPVSGTLQQKSQELSSFLNQFSQSVLRMEEFK